MPKVNFNVPFLNELGEPVLRIKMDAKKIKVDPNTGQAMQAVVTDEEGNAVQEVVTIKDMVVKILTLSHEGDEKLSFSDIAVRGKLARKVQTSNTANYPVPHLTMIQELAAKARAQSILVAQMDDLINGSDEAVTEAEAETEEKAA